MKFSIILAMTAMMIMPSAFARKGTQWGPGGGNLVGCYTSDSAYPHCYCSGDTGNNCSSCGPGSACTFPISGGGIGTGGQKPVGKDIKKTDSVNK